MGLQDEHQPWYPEHIFIGISQLYFFIYVFIRLCFRGHDFLPISFDVGTNIQVFTSLDKLID